GGETQPPAPAPQMFTVPAQPASGQPISLHAFFTPYAYGYTPEGVTVVGDLITATVGPVGCAFGPCPPGIGTFYGPVVFDLPPLPAGSYTVRVVQANSPTVYAQYPLAVVGAGGTVGTASAPALSQLMLWCLIALLALPALRILRKASRSISNPGNIHG